MRKKIVLAALFVLVGLGLLVWQASSSRSTLDALPKVAGCDNPPPDDGGNQ